MGSQDKELFVQAIESGGHTSLLMRTGNYGLNVARMGDRWVLPVEAAMPLAVQIFNESDQPAAYIITAGKGGRFTNTWVEAPANPNECVSSEVWGIDPHTLGIFGAFMYAQNRGIPWVVVQGAAGLGLAGVGNPDTIRVYRRTLQNPGSGPAPTMQYPRVFIDPTYMVQDIEHTAPGTATYHQDAQLLMELVLVGRDQLPEEHRREAAISGWGWQFKIKE